MKFDVSKMKYMICSRGKPRKQSNVYVYGTPIERVDTLLYLKIVIKFNNTFQTAIKNNVDETKKVLHKLAVDSGKFELEVETKMHLFDALIKSILLYGCEVWGYENVEQFVVFHRSFLRNILNVRKGVPKVRIYVELGQTELNFSIWQRMASYWNKVNSNNQSLLSLMLEWLNHENKWSQGVKNILINCGIPTIENYVNHVNDNEFNNYIKRSCEDLANQSWQTIMRATPLCEC